MKIFTIFRSGKYGPLQKTMLLLALILAGVVLFQQIAWAYHQVQSGMGHEMAQIAIAFHVLLLLGMIAVGIGLGYLVDRMIRQQRFVFRSPLKGSWAEIFINLWGYELKCGEEAVREIVPPSDPIPGCDETLAFLDLPARRGRKPTFPLERWLPIAVQWENRDPIRDAFTLGELICEHLGTNLDGSPIVSEQTYYSTWRPRAIEELQRRAKIRKSPATRKGVDPGD